MKLYYATRKNEGRRTEVATVLLFDRLIGLFSLVLIPFLIARELLRGEPTLRQILWIDGIRGLAMCPAMALAMFSKAFGREFSKLFGRLIAVTALGLYTVNPGGLSWKPGLVASIGIWSTACR